MNIASDIYIIIKL